MPISKKIKLEVGPQNAATFEFIQAINIGSKTLATGVNQRSHVYHIGGFKGSRWYNKQLDRICSKRDYCKKGSRHYKHLSKVYKRISQRKRNKQKDSLHMDSSWTVTKTARSIP